MSKIWYDDILNLSEIESEIKKIAKSQEEREELWQIVDEIVHHKVLSCVLDHLPHEHHEVFINRFHKSPHDESLLGYLKRTIGHNIEELIRQEIGDLASEILGEIIIN